MTHARACCRERGGSCASARGRMKPGHALAHRSGHRHKNSKGGQGRGVQRDGCARGKGRRRGEGRGQERAARRVPARAGRTAAEHRSKRPARTGCDARQGWWRGRAVAGGLHPGRGGASDWRVGSMCLRVPTARPRSTRRGRGAPQQATCTNRLRASRAVAGQAVGLHQNTTSGRGGG